MLFRVSVGTDAVFGFYRHKQASVPTHPSKRITAMNRIILIGNGFDLAHGLKTSYSDFIADYWTRFAQAYLHSEGGVPYEDELVKLENTNGPKGGYDAWSDATYERDALGIAFIDFVKDVESTTSYRGFKSLIETAMSKGLNIALSFKSRFFKEINLDLADQKWVDIENVYYRLLKELHGRNAKEELVKLNEDLTTVKRELAEYLSRIQNEKITSAIVNTDLTKLIVDGIMHRDISNRGVDRYFQFISFRYDNITVANSKDNPAHYWQGRYFKYRESEWWSDIRDYLKNYEFATKHLNNITSRPEIVPYIFFVPKDILLLNFNYTTMAGLCKKSLQLSGEHPVELCNIHGELGEGDDITNDRKNPMIFGYGDEIDEYYKKISECNDNEYLHNIKSIRYLETDNYRKLLSFIESAPYQVYVMGHSCGNSDRTLLNTLFEHDNCISIKPFYYEKEKKDKGGNVMRDENGKPIVEWDNYTETVQNISRNFKDPTKMRDRVVNKTYCEPMPQNIKEV
jgi:hypothetical protein